MAKVLITGTVDVSPEKREAAIRSAKELIDEALGEPGCLAYAWSLDPFDPGRIHVFEEWESEESLAEHFRAPSYTNMLAHLVAVGIRGARTQKYRVDAEAPVYGETGKPTAEFPAG